MKSAAPISARLRRLIMPRSPAKVTFSAPKNAPRLAQLARINVLTVRTCLGRRNKPRSDTAPVASQQEADTIWRLPRFGEIPVVAEGGERAVFLLAFQISAGHVVEKPTSAPTPAFALSNNRVSISSAPDVAPTIQIGRRDRLGFFRRSLIHA